MHRKFSVKHILALSLAVMMVFVAACGSQSSSGPASNPAPSASTGEQSNTSSGGDTGREPIQLGVITPLTGGAALQGNELKEGAELAAKQINDAGGILGGRPVEVLVEDDKSLPEQGVTALKRLTSQGVKFITGTTNTSVAIAIANVVNSTDAIYTIPSAQGQQPLDEQTKGTIFGFTHTNATFGKHYHKWVAENLKPKTVYVLAENTDFGKNEIMALEENWSSADAPQIVATDYFERTENDFSVLLNKVRQQQPDALYVVGAGSSILAAIFKQADQMGIKAYKLMNAGTLQQTLVEEGGSAVEGLVSADVYHPDIDSPANQKFIEDFEKVYNKKPTALNVLGWEAAATLLQAIDKAGTADDLAAISKTLKEGTWESPRGQITFDETGRAQAGTYIVQVQDGVLKIAASSN